MGLGFKSLLKNSFRNQRVRGKRFSAACQERLPRGDQQRTVMRVPLPEWVGPELENLRIHIHPSRAP
jgi:hypothetical protein